MTKKLSLLHQDAIPYLYYDDPARAVDGGVMHAEVGVGGSAVMLGPAREEFGFKPPAALPARHSGVWCYVDDADAHCARARAAGATIVREPTDQFYGVREYTARDLEGHEWFFATPLPGHAASAAKRNAAARRPKARAARSKPAKKAAKRK
jgi:uncharacterized glyoxalase superfamily protein PhnB